MTDAEFQAVFDAHKDAVYRFVWRMIRLPAPAEDITQDVFVTLLRSPARFDPARGTLRAFLLGIARNLVLKHWRAEQRFEPLEDGGELAGPFDLGRGDTGEMVSRAVGALVPLQREVVILAEYEGLTLAEIGRAVDADVGTVKSRLHRGRENLRRMLAPLRSRQHATT